MRKIKAEVVGGDRLWTSYASPVALLFQDKLMFQLKIMLISDEPLLSSQPPLDGHLLVPEGGRLKESQLFCHFPFQCVSYFITGFNNHFQLNCGQLPSYVLH